MEVIGILHHFCQWGLVATVQPKSASNVRVPLSTDLAPIYTFRRGQNWPRMRGAAVPRIRAQESVLCAR
jgi:hypothetical protein